MRHLGNALEEGMNIAAVMMKGTPRMHLFCLLPAMFVAGVLAPGRSDASSVCALGYCSCRS